MNRLVTIVRAESAASLPDYASVSIAFDTTERLDLAAAGVDQAATDARVVPLSAPITKDYDAIAGNHPLDWRSRFDVRPWLFLGAYRSGRRVGGAIVISGDATVQMVEGRDDLALLWDLRVAPDARGRGVGSALLRVAQDWAWARGRTTMKVETQDINVAACRLYARHGFRLCVVDATAYPDFPDETQLLWYKTLAGQPD
jgi:GNAT superfamily N-acetyltransferase